MLNTERWRWRLVAIVAALLCSVASAQQGDVSPQVELRPTAIRTRLDRATGRLVSTVNMVAGNKSGYSIVPPVHTVVQLASNILPLVTMPGALGGAADPGYHTYYYDLASLLTAGKFTAGGMIGFPLVFERPKAVRFAYGVSPRGALYQEQPPVLDVDPLAYSVAEGETLTMSVRATDPENAVVTLGASPALSNAAFQAAAAVNPAGVFTFSPAIGQRGLHFVEFTARDPLGMTDRKTVQITVDRTNLPPTLDPVAPASMNEGGFLSLDLDAGDPDGDPVTLDALTALPSNAVLVSAAQRLYFAPDFSQAGEYDIALQATDGALASPTQTVRITVVDVPATEPGDTNRMTLIVDSVESPTLQPRLRVTGRVNVGTNVFEAQAGTRSALVTGLNPAGALQGETLDVTLAGQASGPYATHFAAGGSRADFGEGITIQSVSVTGSNALTARIAVAPDAAPGVRSVTVATENEMAVCVLGFLVERGHTTLAGRLIDGATSNAIAGAVISIEGTTLKTTTAPDGTYRLDNIPPGDHVLIINPPNHQLIRMTVNGDSNQTVNLGTITSTATVFDPNAPASVSLFSVLGRGVTEVKGGVNVEDVRKAIVDSILVVGGSEAGVLDEGGNQLNPNVVSNGLLTLTHDGVRIIADRIDRGETVALADFLMTLSFTFEWTKGHPLSLKDWIEVMQTYVNQAWADPANPASQLPILIFNRGRNLSPDPPVLSPDTRLNPVQSYLLAGSLWAYIVDSTSAAPLPDAPARRASSRTAMDAGGAPYFTGYWRNCFNAKQNFISRTFNTGMGSYLVLTMTASVMMMSGSLAGALIAMPVVGAVASHLVAVFGTIKFAQVVPAPPALTSAAFMVNTDGTSRVEVHFKRSTSDLMTNRYAYALYRFRRPEDSRWLVDFSTMTYTNRSNDLVLADRHPVAGTWFYAVTLAVTFSTDASLTKEELIAAEPWWNVPFSGQTDPFHNFMRSKQKMMSDYSNPGIVYVGLSPPGVHVDGLAIDQTRGDAYLSDTSGDPRSYTPTNWPKFVKIADDDKGTRSIFAYPGFKALPKGLAIDREGALYSDNADSDAQFGGRIFRFAPPDGARDFAGSINYFSRDLMFANPAAAGPSSMGPGAIPASSDEDLYIVDNLSQRVLRAPVRAAYDPYRRVSQPFADIPVVGNAVDLDVTPRGNAYLLMTSTKPKFDFPQITYPNQAHGGEPVCFQTGYFSMSETDFAVPGSGRLLGEIVRTYTVQNLTNGPLGAGWDYNYNLRLEERWDEEGALHVLVGSGFGTQFHFQRNRDGSFSMSDGWRLSLAGSSNAYVLSDGIANKFTFDTNGTLTRISDARTPESVMTLTHATVTAGTNVLRVLEQLRDGLDRPILTLTHDGEGRITSVRDRGGARCVYAYDAAGNLASVSNSSGQTMAFAYDDLHRMTAVTYPNGDVMLRNGYNEKNQVTNQFYRGGTFRFEYHEGYTVFTDRNGHQSTYFYNPYGNLTKLVDALGNTTEYIWDADRNLRKVLYPNGTSMSYEYDEQGNTTAVTNTMGDAWHFAFNASRQVTRITDPLGRTKSFSYDGNGNLVAVTNAAGGVTSAAYDGDGKISQIANPRGDALKFGYNADAELAGFEDPASGLSQDLSALDRATNAVSFNELGLPETIKGLYGDTRCEYDALGNVKQVTDDLGHTFRYGYDTQGRMTNTTYADGTSVRYDRDGEGLIVGCVAPNGKSYRSTRDPLGRIVQNTDPMGHTWGYAYDAVGNLTAHTNANGKVTRFAYDALRRLAKVTGFDGTVEQFEYDAVGNLKRAWCESANCDIRLDYDDLNRLLAKRVLAPYVRTIAYTYDAMGKRRTMRDADGNVTTYTYDLYHHATSVSNRLTGLFQFLYQPQEVLAPAGNLSFVFYPNGCKTHIEYDGDAFNLASSVKNCADGPTNTIVLSFYEYDYDALGNRVSMQSAGNSEQYDYNAVYVITNSVSTLGDSPSLSFDSMGNRLALTRSYAASTSYRYDDANRMLQAGAASFQYDDSGNLIRKDDLAGTTRYDYDYGGRLKSIAHPDGALTAYRYDPFGNLLSRTDGTNATYYVYDGLNLIEELDGEGRVRVRYINGPNLDEVLARIDAEGLKFYLYDGIGNIVDVVDTNAATLAHYDYDPFGRLIRATGATSNDRLFMARPYDARSGLYYFRYRFYAPEYGRFITPDPMDESRGDYVYALNNPLAAKDPMGLMATPTEPQHNLATVSANPLVAPGASHMYGPLLYEGYFHKYYPEMYKMTLRGQDIHIYTEGNIYVTLPWLQVDAGEGLGPARLLVYEPEWFRGYYKPPHIHGPLCDVPFVGKNRPFFHALSGQIKNDPTSPVAALMTDVEYSEGTYRVVFKDSTFKDIKLRSNQIKKDFKAVDVRSSESLDVYKVGAPQDGKIENLLEVDGVPLTKDNLRFVAEKKVEKVRLKNGKEFVLRTGDEIWVGDACYENGVKIMDYATEADKVTIKYDPKTGKPMLTQRKAWWRGEKVDNIFHQVHLREGSYGKSAADYFLTRRFWVGGDVHINGSPRFIPGAPTIAGYGLQALPIYFAMKAPSGYERAREAAGGIGSTSMALGFSVIGGMVGDGPGIFIGGFMGGIYGDILGREALDQSLHYGRQNVSVPILQLPSN